MIDKAIADLAMLGMAIERLDQVERAEEEFRAAAAERGMSREWADLMLEWLKRKCHEVP